MEFINLKAQYEYLKADIDKRVLQTMKKGKFILSDEVQEFEIKIADYVNRKFAVSCGNGTEALQLIFMAYGIGIGDAVFCPDMTFVASVEPAVMLGAHPVFCDINLNSYNLDPAVLELAIKETIKEGIYTPKAIIGVDFLGNPMDYQKIQKIADQYHLIFIEDAAQGMGAKIGGKMCGSFGDISATSFFPTKPLGCYGDGGAVFTDQEEMNQILQSLRVHGKGKSKYDTVRIGINSRLDTIQAAVLLAKMEVLEEELSRRQEAAGYYSEMLKDVLKVPKVNADARSSYAQYIVLAESEREKLQLVEYLHENGIPTLYYYPTPLHKLPVFMSEEYSDDNFPNTITYCKRAFGIPFSPYITKDEQGQVIERIKEFKGV